MSKGVIIHLDDLKEVLETSKNYFQQLGIPLEYICCSSKEEFRKKVEEHRPNLRVVIFDLVKEGKKAELKDGNPEFKDELLNALNNINVPLFIFSGHLDSIEGEDYNGTVFKFDKGKANAFADICNKIKIFFESGFLEIFCPYGILENEILQELNRSFRTQFTSQEDVDSIIIAIQKSGGNFQKRVQEVFIRIAVRSLLSSLMIDRQVADDGFNEAKISVMEHFIRRMNLKNVPVWTGDVFESKDKTRKIIILSPRCDLASKAKSNLLVCSVLKDPELNKKNAVEFLMDNIKFKKFRYLPFTPIFGGEKVDLSDYSIISMKEISEQFDYIISLSDDLTNEILGKFCAYLLRTSSPEVNAEELKAFF